MLSWLAVLAAAACPAASAAFQGAAPQAPAALSPLASLLLNVTSGLELSVTGAGTPSVNGIYFAVLPEEETTSYGLKFAKKDSDDYSIGWWPAQTGDRPFPEAWYIVEMPSEKGVYFQPRGNHQKFPVGDGWQVYGGPGSAPGLLPPPRIRAIDLEQYRSPFRLSDGLVDVRGVDWATIIGAGSAEVNGVYKMSGDPSEQGSSIKFTKRVDANYRIGWWTESPGQWPAAWYITLMPGFRGMYYNAGGDGARLPLEGWKVYRGSLSAEGEEPAPVILASKEELTLPGSPYMGLRDFAVELLKGASGGTLILGLGSLALLALFGRKLASGLAPSTREIRNLNDSPGDNEEAYE